MFRPAHTVRSVVNYTFGKLSTNEGFKLKYNVWDNKEN